MLVSSMKIYELKKRREQRINICGGPHNVQAKQRLAIKFADLEKKQVVRKWI